MKLRHRLISVLVMVSLAGCGGGGPTTSVSAVSSAAGTASAAGPPQCTEATLAYDASAEVMLLLNCVDQFDDASVEQSGLGTAARGSSWTTPVHQRR